MQNKSVIFIDGKCLVCNNLVKFLNFFDFRNRLNFSNLQGDYAREHLNSEFINSLDTVVYLSSDQRVHVKSSAILRVLSDIFPLFIILKIFLIIPHQFRDIFYDILARNRYKLGAELEICPIPPKNIREKFLY